MIRRTWRQWRDYWWDRFLHGDPSPGPIKQSLSVPAAPKRATVPPIDLPFRPSKEHCIRLPEPPRLERLSPAPGGRGNWLLPRVELTPGQLALVEVPSDRHRLVVGFPGSGKTQVLVHRAECLRRTGNLGPRSFRVFLFTNVLRDYIRSALDLLDLPPEAVCTFDAWCHDFYAANIRKTMPRRTRTRDGAPDFDAIRRAVLECVTRRDLPWERLDFALVDEGQDLPREAYLILNRIARHVTVFADPHQQIYHGGASLDEIRGALGMGADGTALLGAYRNSPYVARLAARFIDEPTERARYLSQGRTVQKVKERPLLFVAPTFDTEMDRLAAVVRRRQELNQRVGILAPGRMAVEGVADALAARGVEVEPAVPPPVAERTSGRTWVRFDSMTPKVVGLHGAKGLTFDCVLLPRVTEDALDWLSTPRRRRLLFSAIARATQWVYLSTVEPGILVEIEVLKAAELEGDLIVQRFEATAPPPDATNGSDYSIL